MTARSNGRLKDMPTSAPIKRLNRPPDPRRFRQTERDLALLLTCARFRFASSVQLARSVGGSPQVVVRRLQHLFAHGYVDRPPSQFTHLAAFVEGSQPLIYALARKGAQCLAEHGHRIRASIHGLTQTNESATAPFLAHTLEIADVVIAAEQDCTAHDYQLIDQHELIAYAMPEATRKKADPLRLRVSYVGPDHRSESMAVVPDRLFAVMRDGQRWNLALELDRGTERIRNKFALKHRGYFEAWRQGAFREQWAFERLRVLTVTTSEKRIDSMIAAQRAVLGERAPGLFLYTTRERLAHGRFLGRIWKNVLTDRISLVPSAT